MGDLVVGARSGSGEPEGHDSPQGKDRPKTPAAAGPAAAVEDSVSTQHPGSGRGGPQAGSNGGQAGRGSGGPADDHPDGHGGGSHEAAPNGISGDGDGDEERAGDLRRDRDGGRRRRREEKKQRPFWKELPILIGIALLLALVIKTFFVQAFSIPSDSMQDTLQRGDRVLVDKLTPWFGAKPQRGEVVVFHDPGGWLDGPAAEPNAFQKALSFIGLMPSAEEKDLIKRVIAVGGDKVECSGTGPVKVNGKELKEPYVFPGATPCGDRPFGPVTVPEGRIWVMGDHRNDSLDSRYHQKLPGGGTIDEDQVVGRAFSIAWPVSRWGLLPVPDTFDQPGLASAVGAAGAAPAALGLLGAVPLTLVNRRRLIRRAGRPDEAGQPAPAGERRPVPAGERDTAGEP